MVKAKSKNTPVEPIEALKRLVILQLYRDGASTSEIGYVLGVSYKTVERMMPLSVKAGRNKRKK